MPADDMSPQRRLRDARACDAAPALAELNRARSGLASPIDRPDARLALGAPGRGVDPPAPNGVAVASSSPATGASAARRAVSAAGGTPPSIAQVPLRPCDEAADAACGLLGVVVAEPAAAWLPPPLLAWWPLALAADPARKHRARTAPASKQPSLASLGGCSSQISPVCTCHADTWPSAVPANTMPPGVYTGGGSPP